MIEGSTALAAALASFRLKVNEHPRIRTLLRGWDRVISVESLDTAEAHVLLFRDTRIAPDDGANADDLEKIMIRGNATILGDVFEGRLNPATAFLHGQVEVFASDRDQVKLDAICLVLWD